MKLPWTDFLKIHRLQLSTIANTDLNNLPVIYNDVEHFCGQATEYVEYGPS